MDSDVELRKEVFAWFGAAAYHAQCVEVELIIARLFLLRRGEPEPRAEVWQKVEGEKRTLGNLLRFLRNEIELGENEVALLTTTVDDRNSLAHDYWYRRSSLLATRSGCRELVANLQEMSERLKQAAETAKVISKRVRAQAGIAETVVRQIQEDFVQRLQQGESEDAIIDRQKRILKKHRSR